MATPNIDAEKWFAFTWTIKNFRYCWQKKGEGITSPVFSLYIPEETKWKLRLFPRGIHDDNKCSIFLHREKDCNGAENLDAEFYLESLPAETGSLFEKSKIKRTFCKNSEWGFPGFRSRKDLLKNRISQDIFTIRCRIEYLDQKSPENRQLFAETSINIEMRCLLWTIPKFSWLKPDLKKWLVVKSTSNDELIKIEFFLSGDQYPQEKMNLDIYPSGRRVKYFTLQAFLINTKGGNVNSSEYENWCEPESFSTFPLTFTRSKLIKENHLYLTNDVLSLRLEFTYSSGFAFEGVTKIDFGAISGETTNEISENGRKWSAKEKVTGNSCILTNNLISLFKEQSLCDMKIQAKSNIFPVHTAILGARSPVFKAMFSADMKEKSNGIVDMSHLEDDTVHQFLLFLYADKLEELEWEVALALYEEADKYAVISLKDRCSSLLKDKLNVKSACRILILSDLHQDEELKIFVQNFILRNAKEIFKSEEWELLEDNNSKLALETMRRNWKRD